MIPWALLPPLRLRGVGSGDVESLEHYLARLAWVTEFRARSILTVAAPDHLVDRAVRATLFTATCIPTQTAAALSEGLERVTGQDNLHCGTFRNLRHILARTALGRNGGVRRWYPMCYASWGAETSYEPLLWRVEAATYCNWHGCRLVRSCSACGSRQRTTDYSGRR